jgi:translation initiation factor 2 subunit 1
MGAPRYRINIKAEDYRTAEEILQNVANRALEEFTKLGGEGEFHRRL